MTFIFIPFVIARTVFTVNRVLSIERAAHPFSKNRKYDNVFLFLLFFFFRVQTSFKQFSIGSVRESVRIGNQAIVSLLERRKFPRYSKQYFTLSLSFSRREGTKRIEKERGLDEKSILSISLDNFVTPVENGVVISQRIAHSFNIVSSIVSERSLEKAGHFFSFTRRGEERWVSRFLSSSNNLHSITTFHAGEGKGEGRDHSPSLKRREEEEVDRVQVDAVAKQALTPTNDRASQHLEGIREQATLRQRCVAWKPRGSFQSTFYYTTCRVHRPIIVPFPSPFVHNTPFNADINVASDWILENYYRHRFTFHALLQFRLWKEWRMVIWFEKGYTKRFVSLWVKRATRFEGWIKRKRIELRIENYDNR